MLISLSGTNFFAPNAMRESRGFNEQRSTPPEQMPAPSIEATATTVENAFKRHYFDKRIGARHALERLLPGGSAALGHPTPEQTLALRTIDAALSRLHADVIGELDHLLQNRTR